MKNWDWGTFLFMVSISMVGVLSNTSIEALSSAVVIGLIVGVAIGLPVAYLNRK